MTTCTTCGREAAMTYHGDCFNGYCSMNCPPPPMYMKVSDYA